MALLIFGRILGSVAEACAKAGAVGHLVAMLKTGFGDLVHPAADTAASILLAIVSVGPGSCHFVQLNQC